MTLRIKNWTKFQHYKHRNPPWVKLHFEILSSADWVMLDNASKLLAVVCILIASKHDGSIPDSVSPAYLKRVAYLDELPNLKPLIDCGFLVGTLAPASVCKQVRTNADTETESETETEQKKESSPLAPLVLVQKKVQGEFDEVFWKVYPHKVAKPKAKQAFEKAMKKASLDSIMSGLREYIANKPPDRSYAFPATWLNQERWNDIPIKNEGVTQNGRQLQDQKLSVSAAAQRLRASLAESGGGSIPPRPSLLPSEGGIDRRLLPARRSTES